jgi:hypothetical protein
MFITSQVSVTRGKKLIPKKRNDFVTALFQQSFATHNDQRTRQNESPPLKKLLEISLQIMVAV